MRLILLAIVFFLASNSFGQNPNYMLWTEAGVVYKPLKNLHTSLEINGRFDNTGIQTFFPQVGLKYKVVKWFSPSIEYRFIVDENKYGNYKTNNRLNLNADFKHEVDRFSFDLRLRYQFEFRRLNSADYNPDFDQAIRFKPQISYNIKGTKFSPVISSEWFYYPLGGGPYYPGFTKIRCAAGGKYNLPGPHEVGLKYQIDKKFHSNDALRHVLSLSYMLELK